MCTHHKDYINVCIIIFVHAWIIMMLCIFYKMHKNTYNWFTYILDMLFQCYTDNANMKLDSVIVSKVL